MKEILKSTYHEIHVPASDLIPFLQALYGSGRVGTLTLSIGTGGVPCGTMVWKERVDSPKTPDVDSTLALGACSPRMTVQTY